MSKEPLNKSSVKLRSKTSPTMTSSSYSFERDQGDAPIEINSELTKNNIEKITSDLRNIKSILVNLNSDREKLNDWYIEQMSTNGNHEDPILRKSYMEKLNRIDNDIKSRNDILTSGNYLLEHFNVAGIPKNVNDREYSKLIMKLRHQNFETPFHLQREIFKSIKRVEPKHSDPPVESRGSKQSSQNLETTSVESEKLDEDNLTSAPSEEVKTLKTEVELNPTSAQLNKEKETPATRDTLQTCNQGEISSNLGSNSSRNYNTSKGSQGNQSHIPLHLPTNVPLMKISSECKNQLDFLDQLAESNSSMTSDSPGNSGHDTSFSPNSSAHSKLKKTSVFSSRTSESGRSQLFNQLRSNFGTIGKRKTIGHLDTKKQPTSASSEDIFNKANELITKDVFIRQDAKTNLNKKTTPAANHKSISEPKPDSENSSDGYFSPPNTRVIGNKAISLSGKLGYLNPNGYQFTLNGHSVHTDETLMKLWSFCGVSPATSSNMSGQNPNASQLTANNQTPSNNQPTSGTSNRGPSMSLKLPSNTSQISFDSNPAHSNFLEVQSALNPVKVCQAFTMLYHMLNSSVQQQHLQNAQFNEIQEKIRLMANDMAAYSNTISHLKHDLHKIKDNFDTKFKLNQENFDNILNKIELLSASAEETRHELKSYNQILKEDFDRTSESLNYQLNTKTRDLNDIIINIQNKFPIMEQRLEQITANSNESLSKLLGHKLVETAIAVIVLINTLFQIFIRTLNSGAALTDNRFFSISISILILIVVFSWIIQSYAPPFTNMTSVLSDLTNVNND